MKKAVFLDRDGVLNRAIIKNGNTLLLGGIIEKQTSDEEEGVPFLRHLPIVGFAFRHHRHEIKDKELIIMISPSW